ncbi:MAG: hypothetical protein ACYC3P_09215 [Bellilinea sp.]
MTIFVRGHNEAVDEIIDVLVFLNQVIIIHYEQEVLGDGLENVIDDQRNQRIQVKPRLRHPLQRRHAIFPKLREGGLYGSNKMRNKALWIAV